MSSQLVPLQTILALNTRLYRNCLVDVTDELAGRVVAERTSTMIFVAAHLFDARIFMAEIAGLTLPHPFPELATVRRVEDILSYPRVQELEQRWNHVSVALSEHLETLSDEPLRAPSSRHFPVSDGSVLGALSFLVQHESYHIGQLSLLRRIHGLAPMKYTEILPAA